MAKNPLNRIAEALEMQNQLFREWIVLNRESIEQNMKMRSEYFPLELEKAQMDIAQQKRWAGMEENLDNATGKINELLEKTGA